MGFQYNEGQSAQIYIGTGISGQAESPTADQRWNLVTVPHVTDPTGFECESYVGDGLAAATGEVTVGIEDGGATGTGTTDLDTPVGGTGGWTADTPKAHTILAAAADIDADDWVNFHYDETGTPAAYAGLGVNLNYVYGSPAGIA